MSTATKHTPGPWAAFLDELVPERGAVYVEGPHGWDDSPICACDYGSSAEENEANAQLIAAAPDMAEALPALIECAEILAAQCRASGDEGRARMYQARAEAGRSAIAKATGQ